MQGVSTGAAAGIGAGVGIPLLIAAVAFGVLFMLERRKRHGAERSAPPDQGHISYDPYYEGGQRGQGYQSLAAGTQPNEMDTLEHRQELDNQGRVPELQGNGPPK